MEAEMKRQAAARRKELEKMEKEKAEAEKSQKKALEKAQSEIYMTMQEARKLQAKRQKEEEVKMESLCVSFLSHFPLLCYFSLLRRASCMLKIHQEEGVKM
jgi:hypothetical protein